MKPENKLLLKKFGTLALVIYLFASLIPTVTYGVYNLKSDESSEPVVSSAESEAADEAAESEPPDFLDGYSQQLSTGSNTESTESEESFRILDSSTNEVITVSARDFLPNAVACEMPVSAPDEAIKAQAVAAYTYYTWTKSSSGLENADFSCNTESFNVYVTNDQLKEKWGDSYEENYTRIKALTDEVYGKLLTQNGEAICSTYFSISNGNTESSSNVWGGELSYLQTVASPGDVLNSAYLSTVKLTDDEIKTALSSQFPNTTFNFELPAEEWFQNQNLSSAGYTNSIDVCGVTLKGTEVRAAFGLSSACFEIEFTDESFLFTVKGRGHGVGMSQAGAIYMAQNGSSYEDILLHYYSGAELTG